MTPVYMVVSGRTRDRARMMAYTQALWAEGLHAQLGAYYLNTPRPVAVFEGDVPADHVTLIERFPSLDHARAFWHSRAYQERVKHLRLDPSAGDYTVTVYDEADLPPHMAGAVDPAYRAAFDHTAVEQTS